VIECAPSVSADVVKVVTSLPLRVPLPSVVVPSRKVSVPVGLPEELDVIVAVNVTGAPLDAEAAELTNTALVAANAMVSVTAAEVLPAKFALPAYLQVTECAPTVSVEIVKVALPLLRVPMPSVVVPSRKLTVPVGVPLLPDVTVAVNVTDIP
jgi:hypothetical protein